MMEMTSGEIVERLARVKAEVAEAAVRSGRLPEEVLIVAVSKRHSSKLIRAAYAAGHRDFGESYVQEWRAKASELADLVDLRWHFIGHIQRKKFRLMVPDGVSLIHSLDDLAGIMELEKRLISADTRQEVLLQVSLVGEASKRGCAPDRLVELAQRVARSPVLRLRGLMTMPPLEADPERARPLFAALRGLAAQVRAELPEAQAAAVDVLSMGMSGDYRVAVAEGATHLRVGTAIFGARPVRET